MNKNYIKVIVLIVAVGFIFTQSNISFASQLKQPGNLRQPTIEGAAVGGVGNALAEAGAIGVLKKGKDYEDVGNGVILKHAVELTALEVLPNGVTIDPTKRNDPEMAGAKITIGAGTQLLKGVTLEGAIVVGSNATLGGYLGGAKENPMVVGEGAEIKGLQSDVKNSIIGPGVKVIDSKLDEAIVMPAIINGATLTPTLIEVKTLDPGVVIFGGNAGYTSLRRGSFVGPYGYIEKGGSEHKTLFTIGFPGAIVNLPHFMYSGSLFAFSIVPDQQIKPFSEDFYLAVQTGLRAILFGKIENDETITISPVGDTGALHKFTINLDGQRVTIRAQKINFGAIPGFSDFNVQTLVKSSASVYGGTTTGVGAIVEEPAVLMGALVGSDTIITGVPSPETLIAGGRAHFEKPGYKKDKSFVLGDKLDEKIGAQMVYFQNLRIAAEVFLEGAKMAEDLSTFSGYQAGLNALQVQFREVDNYYIKLLTEALDLSLDNLKLQRNELTNKILGSSNWAAEDQNALIARIKGQKGLNEDEQKLLKTALQIETHEKVGAMREQLTAKIVAIKTTIDSAVNLVNKSVSRESIAAAVREKTMNTGFVWQNPLLAAIKQRVADGAALVIESDSELRKEIVSNLKPFGTEFKEIFEASNIEEAEAIVQEAIARGETIVYVVNNTGNDLSRAIKDNIGNVPVRDIKEPSRAAVIVQQDL